MRRRSALCLLFAFVGVSGCSLLVSLDDLSGARGDAGRPSDAGLGDAGRPSDAGLSDAGDGGSADGARPFCPQAGATLCTTFDDDAGLPGPWDDLTLGLGNIELSGLQALSLPRALRLTTNATETTTALTKKVPVGSTGSARIRMSFALYIAARGANLSAVWIEFGNLAVYFQPRYETESRLLEYVAGTYTDVAGGPTPTGKWVQVDFEVDRVARVATVSLDGKLLMQKTLDPAWASATDGRARLGVPSSSMVDLYYDDVVISVK